MSRRPFEWTQLQLYDEEQRLRKVAEGQVRSYGELLGELARLLAPEAVDQHRRQDPSFFQRLTLDGWRAFFLAIQSADGRSGWLSMAGLQRQVGLLSQQIEALQAEKASLVAQLSALNIAREPLPAPVAAARPVQPVPEASPALSLPRKTLTLAMPTQAPAKFAPLFRAWPREGLALAILAQTGWSLRHAIAHELSAHVGISAQAGSLKRMFAQMGDQGLWRMETVEMGRSRAVIVMLTEQGCAVAQSLGIEPVTSEWEIMQQNHGGDRQQSHTALVCTFTHQARLRQFATQLCPEVEGHAEPDVLITQGETAIYVEVEAESGSTERRMKKWRNQAELQGYVALCASTPEIRQRLVAEARAAAKHGKATDVSALMRGDPLWVEEW